MTPDIAVYVDGGCTANPGELAVAAVACTLWGEVVVESVRRAGVGTNNVAEYRALAHGICLANMLGARQPIFSTDSMLVAQQVNGWWAMRGNRELQAEHQRCVDELMCFDRWVVRHVSRALNKRADWLVSGLLGHGRTLKNKPGVTPVGFEGDGRPGWSQLGKKEIHAA